MIAPQSNRCRIQRPTEKKAANNLVNTSPLLRRSSNAITDQHFVHDKVKQHFQQNKNQQGHECIQPSSPHASLPSKNQLKVALTRETTKEPCQGRWYQLTTEKALQQKLGKGYFFGKPVVSQKLKPSKRGRLKVEKHGPN